MQKQYEAKVFLSKDKRTFAPNRFQSKKDTLSLIDNLYDAGAKTIFITGIFDYKSDDEMCADQMIVQLPQKKPDRAKVFALCNQEIEKEGFDPEEDKGQSEIKLWWD
ncbi:MAG TPA: hypothetical protein VIR98_01970 [Candidatus Paceibacterota bacterium]|jgi:hypothetical protein